MALVHIDHVPETVKVNLPLNVILPDPGRMGATPVARRKVLYLLHGNAYDIDYAEWSDNMKIDQTAGAMRQDS